MAEFQSLPSRIQDAAQSQFARNEQVRLCILASYANIRFNLPFPQITAIKLERRLKHLIFGQAYLEIEMGRNRYIVNNLNYGEAKRAMMLISLHIAP